jgi:hypothetical protein
MILNEATHRPADKWTEHLASMVESFEAEPNDEIQRAWVEETELRLALYIRDYGGALSEEEMFDSIGMNDKDERSIPLIFVAAFSVTRKPVRSGGRGSIDVL